MARKKNTEAPTVENHQAPELDSAPETATVPVEETEVPKEETPDPTIAPQETKETEEKQKNEKQSKNNTEIPEFVKKLLQKYPNYSALYVDTKGGVFTKDTQPNLIKDAILYQNPYYKQ